MFNAMVDAIENIKQEEHYGQLLSLWIISPIRGEWILVDGLSPGYIDVKYDIDDAMFMKGLVWVNVGALWFLRDQNPNAVGVDPVYLPTSWVQLHAIRQSNLIDVNSFELDRSSLGESKDKRNVKEKQQRFVQIQEQAAKESSPLSALVLRLQQWTEESLLSKLALRLLERKGYELIKENRINGTYIKIYKTPEG